MAIARSVISNGNFTVNPTEFLEEGLVAVESSVDGYIYTVAEDNEEAATVVDAGEAAVADVPETITDVDDKALAESVQNALNDAAPSVKGEGLEIAAETIAQKNELTAESAEVVAALEAADVDTANQTVTIVIQPYLAMEVTAADAETETFTLNITPMYRTIAATDTDNIVLTAAESGSAVNAAVVGNAQRLSVNKPVTVEIPLPADFVEGKTQAWVLHKGFVYNGTIDANILTFENPHGFSDFVVTMTEPERKVTGVSVVDGTDGYTPVTAPVVGQKLTANIETTTGTIGSYPVNEDATYRWYYQGADDGKPLGTEAVYTVTSDNEGKILCVDVSVKGYAETATWTAKKAVGDNSSDLPTDDSGSSGGSGSTTYAVSVNTATNGTVSVSPRNASKGATVTITVTPNEGYVLGTLTATDANGDTISLSNEGDGKYTFTMPASRVTVSATFVVESEQELPFTDVASSEWYYEAVQYVYNNELMNGMSATTFEPNSTTTRGMIVTMLYRLENEPTAASAGFSDVAEGQWYTDAVNWAAANNIVNGYGDGQFGPTDTITREQMMAILYRYAQYKGYDVTASADLSAYTDAANISSYAVSAMQWAVSEGLINGITDTTLVPGGSATRAQVAAILMRFCENVAK